MSVSIRQLKEKAAVVESHVDSIRNALPDNCLAEYLENDYSVLYSMILEVIETLDCIISDVEK